MRVVCVYRCVCVCVCVSMFSVCVLCEYVQCVCESCASMYVRVCFARVCVFVCVCVGQISSLPSVTVRIQSSPDGADSNFLRWLTDFHVINNNCGAVVPLPNNFLYCSPKEEDEGIVYLILILFC